MPALLVALAAAAPPATAQTTAFDPVGQRLRLYIELRPWAPAGHGRSQPPFELVNWAGAVGDPLIGLPRGWCLSSNGHPFASRLRPVPELDTLAQESCVERTQLRLVRPPGAGRPVDSFAVLSDLEALDFTGAYWLPADAAAGRDYTADAKSVRLRSSTDGGSWIAKLEGGTGRFMAQSQITRLGTADRLQMGYDVQSSGIHNYDRMGRAVFVNGPSDPRIRTVYEADGFRPERTEFLKNRQSASPRPSQASQPEEDAPQATILFIYDSKGRISRLDMPPFPAADKEPAFERRVWRFSFSGEGRLQALHQEGQQRPIQFEHDHLGRLIEITWPDLERESLVYVGDTDRVSAWIDRAGCIAQYGRIGDDARSFRVLETKVCRQGFVHAKDYQIVDGKVTNVVTSTETDQRSTKR